MHNVFSTLLGPILVLWLGALVFYVLDRFLEPQDGGVAETVVLTLAMGVLAVGRARVGAAFRFGRVLVGAGWPASTPFLLLDQPSWILALIVLGAALAASLASLGGRVRGRAGRTATLGAVLFLFSAGDWATLALTWILVDVALLYAMEEGAGEADERDQETERRRRVAFVSLGGAVLLGLAVTLWQLSGGDLQGANPPPWPAASLAILAALLRLLPWPLPSWYDGGVASDVLCRQTPIARVVPFMTSTVSGVYLWSRLGAGAKVAEGGRWLNALALWAGIALVISALRAWNARDPRQLIERAAPYGAALTLLAAGLGLPAQWQLLAGASAVLNVCALYVGWTQCQYLDVTDLRSYWRVAPTGLALLSLAGLPLTIGFPARAAIYGQIFADGRWLVLLLVLLGEASMLGALVRVLLDVECIVDREVEPDREVGPDFPVGLDISGGPEASVRRNGMTFDGAAPGVDSAAIQAWLRNPGYVGGAMLALAIMVLGVAPGLLSGQGLLSWIRLPRMQVWAALLLPAIGAIVLYRSQELLLAWMDEWWPLLRRVLDVRWVYRAIEQAAYLVGTIVWGASQVIEGAGYMAWVLVFCLVALLFLQTS